GVHRGPGRAQGSVEGRRARDGAPPRRAADGYRVEGIPRADVPGDRRSRRLPVEHGQNPSVSGTHGPQTGTRQDNTKAMTVNPCAYTGDRDATLIAYLYSEIDEPLRD